MAVIVQKYGGSSVADLEKLRRVAEHVVETRDEGHDVVVVVSAMGNTTEELLALANDAAVVPEDKGDGAEARAPRRELDMLVSTGERVSMALLSIAIRARGRDAVSFTGSQSGIITNDQHFDARILEVRPHRIEDGLQQGKVVIVAGYQGMSTAREITTLGRGGSDTTAVALAAALGAERCEIYSDVDGVYSADPRSVPAAEHLPEISYEMLQEMAESGAKVVNAQAVEWARREKIKLLAKKTGGAGEGKKDRHTIVLDNAPPTRAVVTHKNVALIRARGAALDGLLEAAAATGLPLRDLALAGTNVVACAPLLNVPDWPKVRSELSESGVDGLVIGDGLSSVSLIGVDVGTNPSHLAKAFGRLDSSPLWVTSSPLRVSCIFTADTAGAMERAWHEEFVERPAND